jgi:hypothetical protein
MGSLGARWLGGLSGAMVASALVGGGAVGLLVRALPSSPSPALAQPYAWNGPLPGAAQRQAVLDGVRIVEGSGAARVLAGSRATDRIERAMRALDAGERTDLARGKLERELAIAADKMDGAARGTAILASCLFGILGLCGLLGLLRLKVRGMTVLSCGLLALAAGGGAAATALFDAGPLWVALPTILCTLGLFGQLFATNLLPGSNHPFVVGAEAELAAMAPARRRRHVVVRVGAGIAVSAVAVLGTLASLLWAGGPVVTVFTGAFAAGLMIAMTPLIASVRLGVRERSAAAPPR